MIILTIHDNKAKFYTTPWFAHNRGEALRMFIHMCNDPQHPVCKDPESYTLCEIGTFEQNSGTIVRYDKLEPIARAWELKDRFNTDVDETGQPNGWFGQGKSGLGEHPDAQKENTD